MGNSTTTSWVAMDTAAELALASGNSPLDKAATTAIQSSSPFPALPPAFKGDGITLRVTFLYNLGPGQQD